MAQLTAYRHARAALTATAVAVSLGGPAAALAASPAGGLAISPAPGTPDASPADADQHPRRAPRPDPVGARQRGDERAARRPAARLLRRPWGQLRPAEAVRPGRARGGGGPHPRPGGVALLVHGRPPGARCQPFLNLPNHAAGEAPAVRLEAGPRPAANQRAEALARSLGRRVPHPAAVADRPPRQHQRGHDLAGRARRPDDPRRQRQARLVPAAGAARRWPPTCACSATGGAP